MVGKVFKVTLFVFRCLKGQKRALKALGPKVKRRESPNLRRGFKLSLDDWAGSTLNH